MVTDTSPTAAHRARAARSVPALDGVRALAVLAVLAAHGGVPGVPGGVLGVDVFFVLSGFLITGLLLDEHRRTGRVDLPAFWARRARRLAPALVLVVAVVVALRPLFPADAVTGLRADVLATLAWVANWRFAAAGTDYFATGGTASPLQHTWSLGVEEQFYLLWPPLVVGALVLARRAGVRRPDRAPHDVGPTWSVGGLAAAGATASAALTVVLVAHHPVSRVWFGTDTRAQALLLGAATAALLGRHAPARGTPDRVRWTAGGARAVDVVTAAGLGGLAVLVAVPVDARTVGAGVLTVVAVAAAVVVAGLTLRPTGAPARALSTRPLVALGRISYGVYLWHLPLFELLDGARTGLVGVPLLAVRVAATLVAATATWWLLERPVLRRRALPRRVLPGAAVAVGALAVVAALVVPVTAVAPGAPGGPAGDLAGAPAAPSRAGVPATPAPATPAPATSGSTTPPPAAPARDPSAPLRVDVMGDSVAWTLVHYLPATPGLDVVDHTALGCGLARGGPYRYFGQTYDERPECDSWPTTWAGEVAADHPDEVLLLVGRWETMDRVHDGRWTHLGDPAFDTYLAGELATALDVLGATGARVVVATEPYNRRGEQPDGSLYPEDDPARVSTWNALVRQVVAARPGTDVLDLNAQLCPGGIFTWDVDGVQVRSDGVHLTPEGVRWLTPWLAGALRTDVG